MSADEIWKCGTTVGKKEVGLANMVAESLTSARNSVGMTQCRLADGMDMEIRIEFVPKRK